MKKEEDVRYKSFGRTVFMVLMIFGLIACGASPPVGRAVDTTKIPITTASDEARDAFLKGRWLLDNLRVTDVLNPMDLRVPGLTDIDDLRLPVTMIKLDY